MKWEYAKKGYDNEEEKRNFLVFFAARCGYKGVLQWLKSIGCALSNRACDGARAAAYGGHIKVLKYLKSERVPFDSETCKGAAEGGHIEVLKYLKSEGVEFDSWTCEYAAKGGH